MNTKFNPIYTIKYQKMEQTNNALNIIDYSDKSIVVFGEATRTYKGQLKDLGGRFNGRLGERPGFSGGAGWIFPSKNRGPVDQFVTQVNEGNFTQELPDLNNPNTNLPGGLPSAIFPQKLDSVYQTVKWRVYKPKEGMNVVIKAPDQTFEGVVVDLETHKDIVDTAYVSISGQNSKLVICNGKWQVFGYPTEHTVRFD